MKPALIATLIAICSTATAQESSSTDPSVLVGLSLGGPVKRFCSGLWVSERSVEDTLHDNVLTSTTLIEQLDSGELSYSIDEERRIVTMSRARVSARSRYFDDQGCVILRPGTDKPLFTPRPVVSALPDAASTPWPMGDMLPATPLPADVNVDLLNQAEDILFANAADGRAAFVVLHEGRIIKEAYGTGINQNTQLESYSMGKSMTATLIGRLMQSGHLSLEQPAPVPQWQSVPGDPRSAITIADLLRMSSGLHFSGPGSTPEELADSFIPGFGDHYLGYAAPIDVFQFATSRDVEYPPNTVGRYRNSDPLMLGAVIRHIVENTFEEEYLTWPQKNLFDKIGIRRFIAETDIYGNFILNGYQFGTGRDWARLGQLYLQEGMWEGERLIPEEFVTFVQSPAPAWDPAEYGGLFWRNPPNESGLGIQAPTLPLDTYHALGTGEQHTYIIPSRDMVIVLMSHTAGNMHAPDRDLREQEALGLVVKAVDSTWNPVAAAP